MGGDYNEFVITLQAIVENGFQSKTVITSNKTPPNIS